MRPLSLTPSLWLIGAAALSLAVLAVSSAFGGDAFAQSSQARVEYPAHFRTTMNLYAVVDRADGKVYEIFVNDAALRVWRRERRLPSGTQFVIESFNAQRSAGGAFLRDARGRLVKGESENEIHVTEKRSDWAQNAEITSSGLLFGARTPNGTWRVGAFDPRDGSVIPKTDAQVRECHECHSERRAEDFVLSRGLLDGFAASGQASYISFTCPQREICFGTP